MGSRGYQPAGVTQWVREMKGVHESGLGEQDGAGDGPGWRLVGVPPAVVVTTNTTTVTVVLVVAVVVKICECIRCHKSEEGTSPNEKELAWWVGKVYIYIYIRLDWVFSMFVLSVVVYHFLIIRYCGVHVLPKWRHVCLSVRLSVQPS